MPSDATRRQVAAALRRLSMASLDSTAYRQEAVAVLHRGLGFDAWCWTLVDPASRLPSHVTADNPAISKRQARFFQLTFQGGDRRVSTYRPVSEGFVRVSSAATGGDLRSDARWREVFGPGGLGDELVAHLVADGTYWGHLSLYRDAESGWFSEEDRSFVNELAPMFAVALQRSTRVAPCPSGEADEPGTLVLDSDLQLLAVTPEARRWLHELAPDLPDAAYPLPGVVYALAARVGATAPGSEGGEESGASARVRARSSSGRWLVLRGSALSSAAPSVPTGSVVVTIEPARSAEIAPLLMRAWGLSRREREVAALVIDGLATDEIASALFISPHTVRDHVRSLLDKVGVGSRRHLVAALAGGMPGERYPTQTH